MSGEFLSRIFGMIFFLIVGARLGIQNATSFNTVLPPEVTAALFGLVGVLFGLIMTPYLTVRPVILARRILNSLSADVLLTALLGLTVGLILALLAAYPISLLGTPFGNLVPTLLALIFGYLGMTIFGYRAHEFIELFSKNQRPYNAGAGRELLLDTSVLIDGRIVEVAQTGFLGGTLVVPRFVLSELHQVADSSDPLRRARGRRGLAKLNELQRDPAVEIQIIDDDIPSASQVDDKLVALAIQREAIIITNDYNLNQVAEAQGLVVLNINALANSVRAAYIPGENFAIHVIQEGRENGQGVGYLEDGTMVVIEEGNRYMDRTITVEVTKLLNGPAGRMIFAKPTRR